MNHQLMRSKNDLKDPYLAAFSLIFLHVSAICTLTCIGFSPFEWLFWDILLVSAVLYCEGIITFPENHFVERIFPKGKWLYIILFFLALLISLSLFSLTPEPSYAFFREAENVLKACFTDATSAISIFFSTLRFLLVAYIGAQMVFAVYQISRGESPLPLLMPALAVVIAVAVSSVLTSLVLTGTTCAALVMAPYLALALVF